MAEAINEPVAVTARFEKGRLAPLFFTWHGRDYSLKKVDFFHYRNRGNQQLYFFSVAGEGARYQLVFNSRTFGWRLLGVEAS